VIYFILCLTVGYSAGQKGRSGFGFFILSLLTTPLLGGFCVLLMKNDNFVQGQIKECPFCAETIKKRAKICKYCKQELPVEPIPYLSPYRDKIQTSPKKDTKKIKPIPAIDLVLIFLGIAVFIVLGFCANGFFKMGK